MTRGHDGALRGLGGVLLGFITLIGVANGGMIALTKATAPDDLFQPGTFAPTDFNVGFGVALVAFAAVLAGLVCVAVAGFRRPASVLASVVAALGLATILFAVSAAAPAVHPRVGDEPPDVVREQWAAAKPRSAKIAEPLLAVAGILLGSRLKRREPPTPGV